MQQKKLNFNFFVNRNWKKLTDSRKRDKKLTDSRKRAKILADNRKSHHPIETLLTADCRIELNLFGLRCCPKTGREIQKKKKQQQQANMTLLQARPFPSPLTDFVLIFSPPPPPSPIKPGLLAITIWIN